MSEWYEPLSRRRRRKLADRFDRAFWRTAYRPPRPGDSKYGDEGVLADLDNAARELRGMAPLYLSSPA
jgi:hypothetical protein